MTDLTSGPTDLGDVRFGRLSPIAETPVHDLGNALQIIEFERVHPDTARNRRLLQVLGDIERRIAKARNKLIEADA